MKKIILNQKSYLLFEDIQEYKKNIKELEKENYEIVLFPPMVYLSEFKDSDISIGAQNFYSSKRGSFTGEINIEQLKDLGVKYTMIGHHERRRLLNESSYEIKEKLLHSLSSKMNTLFYIGEIKNSRNAFVHIKRELNIYLKNLESSNLKYLTIVYDPNWAIGSNVKPSIKDIEKMIKRIKIYIKNIYHVNISVLYGGIIDKSNIKDIINISDGIVLGKVSTNQKQTKELLDLI